MGESDFAFIVCESKVTQHLIRLIKFIVYKMIKVNLMSHLPLKGKVLY